MEIPKQYEPQKVESRLYAFWLKYKVFEAKSRSKKKPFTMMMPPPNVTGVLHMGHALVCTLEDIIARRARMLGLNTLWLPGTDHAGIATQMVVERKLKQEEKLSRHDLGREKFLKKVWQWKEQSQGTILSQLKLIGCSCDWSRLRFTLDKDLSRSVREAFVRLYKDGLIYRDKRFVHWCPRCQTAVSDLEVKHIERASKLWYVLYPSSKNGREGIVVATTRPETILGDTGVAVHPDDNRYHKFKGKSLYVPLTERQVPVVFDSAIDKTFGTGALKVTPAHDKVDFEIGKRHGLKTLDIFDLSAHLNKVAGESYAGLSREEARDKILSELKERGLLIKEEPIQHAVGVCDRCQTLIEPRLSEQWFVDAKVLAKPALEAVKKGKLKILPSEWEKNYTDWMEAIEPWCVSRQLWWGHRIPVFYCESCGNTLCETTDPKSCPKCKSKKLRQDDDVLDTWFSSGLWPISTLGWPDKTGDFKTFYPTNVLETGFDILFFWVARMVMLCHRMTGKIPFNTVYLHPMVRDEYGQKMSKTKNNVKDPLEIIKLHGADSLRFTLAAMAVHGRDVLLSDARIEGYRNFVNKIWNAARFLQTHFSKVKKSKSDTKNEVNRWIWSRLNRTKKEVNAALDQYRFFDAAEKLYHFVWHEYCDWFIEFIKSEKELQERTARLDSTAVEVFEEILRLLHPFMPFVTEELWQRLELKPKCVSIAVAPYPQEDRRKQFAVSEKRVARVIEIVEKVRSKRGESQVPPDREIALHLTTTKVIEKELVPFLPLISRLTKARQVDFVSGSSIPCGCVLMATDDVEIRVLRSELLDLSVEKERAKKELSAIEDQLKNAEAKLSRKEFVEKAPAEVVKGVRERQAVLKEQLEKWQSYMKELSE